MQMCVYKQEIGKGVGRRLTMEPWIEEKSKINTSFLLHLDGLLILMQKEIILIQVIWW